jgi:hypothetical protein
MRVFFLILFLVALAGVPAVAYLRPMPRPLQVEPCKCTPPARKEHRTRWRYEDGRVAPAGAVSSHANGSMPPPPR